MSLENKPKIGLALGSGGLRGLAHIGIIKVLLKNNIQIDYISGSSVGSLVGAYFAAYGEIESFEEILFKNSKELLPLFFDFGLQGGIVNGSKINLFLEKILKDKDFSETKIPFYIVATDLSNGQPVFFSSGKLVPAVRASISIPIFFKPQSYQDKFLADGGLCDPVPVEILKQNGANKVLAVNLYHPNEFAGNKFTFTDIALRSTRIALHNLSKVAVKNADLVLNPDTSKYLDEIKVKDYFKVENIKKMIKVGEDEALKYLSEIKKLV